MASAKLILLGALATLLTRSCFARLLVYSHPNFISDSGFEPAAPYIPNVPYSPYLMPGPVLRYEQPNYVIDPNFYVSPQVGLRSDPDWDIDPPLSDTVLKVLTGRK